MPKISIIIPMYKVERYLRRCLDSVKNQTFKDWEAICVDDGSPDKSGEIAEEYAARDKRFVVVHKKNGGVSAARNDGMKYATGKYIMYLDSDDFIHPQRLEIMYKIITEYHRDIVSCAYKKISIDECDKSFPVYKKISIKFTDSLFKFVTEKSHKPCFWAIRHCYPVVHLIDKKLASKILFPIDVKVAEDFVWWVKILLCKPRAAIIKTKLYYYVNNLESALHTSGNNKFADNLIKSIIYSYRCIMSTGDVYMQKVLIKELLWPFIISMFRNANKTSVGIKKQIGELWDMGVFDNPVTMR
ncbi:MAG: glycosyltransferase family 2 protein, partial [Alphaproteobacteria bacterium]